MAVAMPFIVAGLTLASGVAQKSQADQQARQEKYNAGQVEASSQREAAISRHTGDVALSNQRAVGAASNTNIAVGDFPNMQAEIKQTSEYNALSSLYSGTSQADQMRAQAKQTKLQGNLSLIGSVAKAAGGIAGAGYLGGSTPSTSTIGDSGTSLYDKYKGASPVGW